MQLLDTLTVVSSITDYAQILPVAGIVEQTNVQYSRDFLVSSGNYLKSYLTVATSSVPLDMQPLPLKSVKFQENEKLKVERVFTTNNLVFVSYRLLGVTN
jgi:anionic cell wall polymer biosynthesis LytR-Cps2A-Psr (LCP) family protein